VNEMVNFKRSNFMYTAFSNSSLQENLTMVQLIVSVMQ